MKTKLEMIMVVLVLASLVSTSVSTFVVHGGSLTKEEAIEISRNSGLVRKYLEEAERYTLEVHHLNQTQIDRITEEYPLRSEWYPEDHGVWDITWYVNPKDALSGFEYVVTHIIDEETGEITHEGGISLR